MCLENYVSEKKHKHFAKHFREFNKAQNQSFAYFAQELLFSCCRLISELVYDAHKNINFSKKKSINMAMADGNIGTEN